MHIISTPRKICTIIAGALAAVVAVAGTAAASGPWVVAMAQPDTWQFTAAAWGLGRYVAATGYGIIGVSLDGSDWSAAAGERGERVLQGRWRRMHACFAR